MDINELERAAMKNEPMPEKLDIVDQMYFQCISALYSRFRLGMISREEGSKEKKIIEKTRKAMKEDKHSLERLRTHYTELWKRIECAGQKYIHERTIENADKFIETVYGVPTKK